MYQILAYVKWECSCTLLYDTLSHLHQNEHDLQTVAVAQNTDEELTPPHPYLGLAEFFAGRSVECCAGKTGQPTASTLLEKRRILITCTSLVCMLPATKNASQHRLCLHAPLKPSSSARSNLTVLGHYDIMHASILSQSCHRHGTQLF